MTSDRHIARRAALVAVLAGVVPAIGLAGCGDSDERERPTGGGADRAQREQPPPDGGAQAGGGPAPPALTGDAAEARKGGAAVRDVYSGFGAAVAAGLVAPGVSTRGTLQAADDNAGLVRVCDLMSEDARRQTIAYAEETAGLSEIEWSCEKATALLLRRTRQTGRLNRSLRADVVDVNANGGRATATVRFGGRDASLTTIALVKEDGRWKLDAPPGGGR